METEITTEEAHARVDYLQQENDIVRIVDPVTREVLYWPIENPQGLQSPCLECNSVWGRTERCPNCSSLEAVKLQQRTFKVEISSSHAFWVLSRPLVMDGRSCVMETVNDVTEGLMVEGSPSGSVGDLIESLNELIISDALTTLRNRRFLDDFCQRLPELARTGTVLNVGVLDVDCLKQVNDTYGHTAGDALIKDVAGFLKLHYDRRSDSVEYYAVRYGGDEFVVIGLGVEPDTFAREMRMHYESMRRVCYYEEFEIPFSMSLGAASSDEFGWDWTAVLRAADERMYADKNGCRM